jgi:glycosyltransferase involved in cell wall biosynthesis
MPGRRRFGDADLTAILQRTASAIRASDLCRAPTEPRHRAATNEALRLCTGEYVAFLDHDDELAGFALSEVVTAINDDPDTTYSIPTKTKSTNKAAATTPSSSPIGLRICSALATISVTLW